MADVITRSAPGKLFVAGEYAVLEPGCPAVLVAVDRHITVGIAARDGDSSVLRSDLAGGVVVQCRRERIRLVPQSGDPALSGLFDYALSALHIVDSLAAESGARLRPVEVNIQSTLVDEHGRKLGLGSSAAVVVATVDAAAAFYKLELTRMDRFRAALLAVCAIDPEASGGDIAASTWGGWIAYTAPDRRKVAGVRTGAGITGCLQQRWPQLSIRALPTPANVALHVGWTGEPVRTTAKTDALRRQSQGNKAPLDHFRHSSTDCVTELTTAILADDSARMRGQIDRARGILADLDRATGIGIFTPRLTALCAAAADIGGAAKPSGAGGGDCGIALLDHTSADRATELADRWAGAGIRALTVRATDPKEHADGLQS